MRKLLPVYIRIPVLFFTLFGLIEFFIDSGDRPAFIKYPIICIILLVFLFFLIAIETLLQAVDDVLYQVMTDEQRRQAEIEENIDFNFTNKEWYKTLMQRLTKAEPLENEMALLLDHDYDGIKELDNKLPPWWLYLFYGGIVFAAIYLVRFELLNGDNQETELRKEIAQAKIDIAKYMLTAPDQMEESKVTLLTDSESTLKGKTIFINNCAACHREDGSGQIGPNLTDQNWIFGGSIKNVFHTITNGGRDGKGMVAWKAILKPTEIQQVASYVLSLQGSNPKDVKAPDGEIWIDPNVKNTATTALNP